MLSGKCKVLASFSNWQAMLTTIELYIINWSVSSHYMRQFAITAFLFFLRAFAFGQIVNDDMTFFNYSYDKTIIKLNKVETLIIQMYFSDGKSSGKIIYHFNKEGLLTRQTIQDATGIPEREYYFSTNDHNDLISRIQKDYEHNRTDTVIYFKSYEGDKLIKDSSSDIPVSFNYEYTINGKLLKTIVNSNFGLGYNRKRVIINKLDSVDRIINIVETVYENEKDLRGSLFSNRDIFYYDNGKIEKEVEKINSNNPLFINKGSINYVYDSNGNLTQILRTNTASYTYTYNDKGLITTKKMDMNLESDDTLDTETKFETLYKFSYTFRQ